MAKKKKGPFYFTMGCFDGAETCQHIIIHLLHEISRIIDTNSIGLHRDDGLIIMRNYNRQKDKKKTEK